MNVSEIEKRFYSVTDVMEMLEIGKSKAYSIIQQLNRELKANGKITVCGRIPKEYFKERVG